MHLTQPTTNEAPPQTKEAFSEPTRTAFRADDVALRATCLRRTALHAPGSACGLAAPLSTSLTFKGSSAGFTVIEIVISATLLAAMLAGLIALTLAGSGAFRAGTSKMDLESRVHVALDRMARELGNAGRGSLFPNPQPVPGIQGLGTSTLDFQACVGAAGTAPIFGPVQRIAFELEASELDNGLDDDADGLVDEGLVAWTSDLGGPSQRRAVLATGVSELLEGELPNAADDNGNGLTDEPGLVFDADGARLVLRLTLQRTNDGRVSVRTSETSVLLRN